MASAANPTINTKTAMECDNDDVASDAHGGKRPAPSAPPDEPLPARRSALQMGRSPHELDAEHLLLALARVWRAEPAKEVHSWAVAVASEAKRLKELGELWTRPTTPEWGVSGNKVGTLLQPMLLALARARCSVFMEQACKAFQVLRIDGHRDDLQDLPSFTSELQGLKTAINDYTTALNQKDEELAQLRREKNLAKDAHRHTAKRLEEKRQAVTRARQDECLKSKDKLQLKAQQTNETTRKVRARTFAQKIDIVPANIQHILTKFDIVRQT
ncbi:hypothetical protein AB1Y20_000999 [Prymnesium parvum]|uniref:Dynein regulatory complex protein 10 n=1 Tax=Prymnesium parvum TaxID=97485 RepID=A0AB34K9M0_PRYPA